MNKGSKFRQLLLFFMLLTFTFSFIYMSPYLTVLGTALGVVTCGMLFWVLFGIVSFFVGRAPCGWFCPLGAMQEYTGDITQKKLKLIPGLHWVRYILFAGWIGTIVYLAIKAGGYHHFSPMGGMAPLLPPYDDMAYVILYAMIIGCPLFVLLLGKRAFCRYFCFFGMPLGRIGTVVKSILNYPSLRLKTIPATCTKCGICDRVCVNSVPVSKLVQSGAIEHRECIMCGVCVSNCPTKSIHYTWSKKIDRRNHENHGI